MPSSYAIGVTLVGGGLALVVDRRPRRYAAGAVLVALMGFSRMAIGVHNFRSILMSVTVGAVYIAVVWRFAGRLFLRPRRAFALAALVTLAGALLIKRHGRAVGQGVQGVR